ncbi:hypothetical protein [Desulfolucanica intricata]|uniref:hypothetical protein n=1 Tax=Desulfolucanica intricata TaxID=1285191 RepID=UPI000831CDC0|nr:hypothetical protein [Desulfolucanica intricata]
MKFKKQNLSSIILKFIVFLFIISLCLNSFLWGQIKSLNYQQLGTLKNDMNSYYSALHRLEVTISQNQIDPSEFKLNSLLLIESSNRLSYFITNFLEVNGNLVLNDFSFSLVDNLEKIISKEIPETKKDELLKEQKVLINAAKETFNIAETQKLSKEEITLRIKKFLKIYEVR